MSQLRKSAGKARATTLKRLLEPVLLSQWRNPRLKCVNERPVEYSFALSCLAKVCPSSVVDVGSGLTAWPQTMADCGFRVTALDNTSAYWSRDIFNRHYHILDDDITSLKIADRFEFVTCISVLEHIPNHEDAIGGIASLLNDGGYAALSFPYNDSRYVGNVYELEQAGYGKDASYACQVFSRSEVEGWLREMGARIVEEQYWEVFTGELWTFGERLYPPKLSTRREPHQLACLLIRKGP